MYKSNPKNQYHHACANGFTLIEVVVALTILAVGILGLLSAFSLCLRTQSQTLRLAEAVCLARQQLAEVIADPAGNWQNRSGDSDRYHWSVDFAEKPCDLILASVTVSWLERGQRQQFRLCQLVRPMSSGS